MRTPLQEYGWLLPDYLGPQWPRPLALVVLLLSSMGLQLLDPQIMRFFLDTAGSRRGEPWSSFWRRLRR